MNIKKAGSPAQLNKVLKNRPAGNKKTEEKVSDKFDPAEKEGAVKPHKKWLFMNYIAGDCNLLSWQFRNINEQEKVGSDENTHIVAYMDVGPEASHVESDWSGARSYYINKDSNPKKINSEVIEEFGNHVDMSSHETLTKFIVDAMKKFPADNVAVVLNDHGGGFTGAMADDSDGSFMSLPELKKGLSDAEKITGKKIDILGFDACLMAEAEVAYELKDQAEIMIASEESEELAGWSYNEALGKTRGKAIEFLQDALKNRIDVSPREFASSLIKYHEAHQLDIPTLSATDLSKMDKLAGSVNNFAKAIINSDEDEIIREAMRKSEHYGGSSKPYKDLHDLHHIADLVLESSSDDKLKEAAEGVKKAVSDTIIANEACPYFYPNSKGMSIYAPGDAKDGPGYNYSDLQFAKDTGWDEAIKKVSSDYSRDGEVFPALWPDGSHRKEKE